MIFRNPQVLWLLLVAAGAAGLWVFAWWRRRRTLKQFEHQPTIKALIHGRSGPWRATRGVLWVLGFSLLIIALSEPQYGSRTVLLRQRGIDVVVALDFSKSMLAQDVRPNRIDRAKAELQRLFGDMEGHRVGMVAFAGETIEFPMTLDYAAINLFIEDLSPNDIPVGGTAIGRALISSKRLLERSIRPSERRVDRSQAVILMTDGEDHEGDPIAAAQELADAGIRVFTVGIGSRDGQPIPNYAPDGTWTGYLRDGDGNVVHTSLTADNEATLEQIAAITEGSYIRAGRGGVGIDQIRAEMARMRQSEQEGRQVTEYEPRFALLLLPAFLLLLLEGLLPDAWIRRRRPIKVEEKS